MEKYLGMVYCPYVIVSRSGIMSYRMVSRGGIMSCGRNVSY